MHKTIYLCLITITTLGFMQSCKKGENDPFLSLRTRKARIAGEWKLSASESKYTSTSPNSSNSSTTTYDGATETTVQSVTINGNTTSTTSTAVYTFNIEFDKNGTYTLTQVQDGETYTAQGTWIFLKRSKEDELKNKEAILLTQTSASNSNGESSTMHDLSGSVFVIDQLKNKEMIWTSDYTYTEDSDVETDHYKMTFTQK